MAKKKEDNKMWIIAIIALIVFIYGGQQGWFSKNVTYNYEGDTVTNQDIINQLENPTPGSLCTIDCVPTTIAVGQSSTCTLRDGANTNCMIYFRYNSGAWQYLDTITTDSSGYYTATRAPGYAGVYEFAAICDDCVTNKETVIVNTADDDGNDAQPTCDFLCQTLWNYDNGDDAVNGVCTFGIFKVDQNGNECCCWDDAPDQVVCQSSWPVPSSQDDCYSRPGCSTDNLCVFVDAGIVGQNSCECVTPSCDGLCRYEGYVSGSCRDGTLKNPCIGGSRLFAGDSYCGGFPDIESCCCY